MANDNSGALFRNKRRETENHPNHTGQATIGGVAYWINGWIKEKDGERYFSLAFKPREERKEAPRPSREPAVAMDDEIPF